MSDSDQESAMLAEMLAIADRLAASEDALLVGQYAHLRARIAALIELRALGEAA